MKETDSFVISSNIMKLQALVANLATYCTDEKLIAESNEAIGFIPSISEAYHTMMYQWFKSNKDIYELKQSHEQSTNYLKRDNRDLTEKLSVMRKASDKAQYLNLLKEHKSLIKAVKSLSTKISSVDEVARKLTIKELK